MDLPNERKLLERFFLFFSLPPLTVTHPPPQKKVAERPTRILHGHNEEVTCVCISVELDMAVSGGKDGRIVIHSLRKVGYNTKHKKQSSSYHYHVIITPREPMFVP